MHESSSNIYPRSLSFLIFMPLAFFMSYYYPAHPSVPPPLDRRLLDSVGEPNGGSTCVPTKGKDYKCWVARGAP